MTKADRVDRGDGRDALGRLMPGKSGNPEGCSVKQARARERVRNILADAAPDAAERLVELVRSENEKIALAASCEIVTRAIGKGTVGEDAPKDAPPRVFRIISPDGTETEIRAGGEDDDGEFLEVQPG